MAIRIREVDGKLIAVCAAKTKPQKGDIYIGDEAHHALKVKFEIDIASEQWLPNIIGDEELEKRMEKTEKNNKRFWKKFKKQRKFSDERMQHYIKMSEWQDLHFGTMPDPTIATTEFEIDVKL